MWAIGAQRGWGLAQAQTLGRAGGIVHIAWYSQSDRHFLGTYSSNVLYNIHKDIVAIMGQGYTGIRLG